MHQINTDVLILGSGGAGLFAALHALQTAPNLDVTIAVKGLLGKCGCTRMVQGGFNVAMAPGDSVERHFVDTIESGKWLSNQDLAWTLVTEAQVRVRELENELGCYFDRNPDGSIHQKAFAGQSFDRTVHKGDLTGIEIINRLYDEGHTIVYWTARGCKSGVDWTDVTVRQLKEWGAKSHDVVLGKPYYDLFIDDKALNSDFYFGDCTD